jgi:Fur family ferric uptake transcriptional regulator
MSHNKLNLAELLHEQGYRLTPQRQMVLDAVCEAHVHATAEQIYELVQQKSGAVNRATIYRTLKFLKEMGLVTTTTLPGGGLEYELAGPRPHHHLVCSQCGIDYEVSHEPFVALLKTLESTYDFQVDSTHLSLYGLCSECQANQ